MNKATIRDIDLKDKRVLVRVDFNVPIENGEVTDDTRVRAAAPTIKAILDQHPRSVLLMSHLGRPKGGPDPKYSLKPVAKTLEKYIGREVHFADETVGSAAEDVAAKLPQGGILLLENTRFYPGEEKNDADLAKQMAKLGDVFVNDAFGSAHRAHSSTVGVTEYLPSVAGLLMEKELDYLATALEDPQRPFVAILGGAKVSDKIKVIESLLGKVDALLIGGGMANTFLAAQDIDMANSLVEKEAVAQARDLLAQGSDKIKLPVDLVAGEKLEPGTTVKTVEASAGIPAGFAAFDIGPQTIEQFRDAILSAKTVVWNGPMGVFETPPFDKGTRAVADLLVQATESGATTIIGGGDSAAAIEEAGVADKISHVSTGGGASLEMLEGRELPGVVALKDR